MKTLNPYHIKQQLLWYVYWLRSVSMYWILDVFFTVFHSAVIAFNLTGWIWKKTRKIHLITVTITLLNWTALGYFYGWGYCFLTDWHYDVLAMRGINDLPTSYITFLIERVSGVRLENHLVILATVITFGFILIITYGGYVYRLWRRK